METGSPGIWGRFVGWAITYRMAAYALGGAAGVVAAFFAAWLELFPNPPNAAAQHYAIVFATLGTVAVLGLGSYGILEIVHERRSERKHDYEREQDGKERASLQTQVTNMSGQLPQLVAEMKLMRSQKELIEKLPPESLKRQALELSNDLIALWGEYQPSRPSDVIIYHSGSNQDRIEQSRKEREQWDRKFMFEFHKDQLGARALALYKRFLEHGMIKEPCDLGMYVRRAAPPHGGSPDEALGLANELGALARNLNGEGAQPQHTSAPNEKDAPQREPLTQEQLGALGDGYALKRVKPLIHAYRNTRGLANRLRVFENGMEVYDPQKHGDGKKWVGEVGKKNSVEYDANHKPYLVSGVTDLKLKFGMTHPALTDEKLGGTVFGPLGVHPMVEGLNELADKLAQMLAAETAKLNV
jgi:hypothetical protein